MAQFIGRKPVDGGQDAGRGRVEDERFQGSHPALFEYLTAIAWDDGSVRQTATLLIFADGRSFKGLLKDRELSRIAFATSDTLAGLLDVLEAGLESGSTDWRQDRPPQGRGGPKRA